MHLTRLVLPAALVLLLALPGSAAAVPTITTLAPAKVVFGKTTVASGTVAPAVAGEQVQLEHWSDGDWSAVGAPATTDAAGAWSASFVPRAGGPVRARQLTGDLATSEHLRIAVATKVFPARLTRGTVYPFLGARARWRVAPAAYPDGKVRIEISIDGRKAGFATARIKDGVVATKIPTNGIGRFRARLVLPARGAFEQGSGGNVAFTVRGARVGAGSSTTWNRSLRAGLRFRGFHVPGGRSFDSRMGEAVIAFHKAYGRSRTTTFAASDWRRLTQKRVMPRYRRSGMHIEIDKGRQILMQVRNGKAVFIIHVSTGRTGNTPVGRHSILWKGNWVPSLYGSLLYKSMAFRGAFAIHGYPSVPTSPGSAGCVRVPMWIASTLYGRSPVGTPVYVYEGPGSTGVSLGRARAGSSVPELTGVDVERWADEGPVAAR